MNIILQGIILGFTLSTVFGFGPALFALIQTSIHRGFWSGVQLAFGVFLSDASLIAVGALGFGQIFYMPRNQMAFGIIGGILLVIFGIVTYSRKVKVQQNEEGEADQANTPGPLTYIFKGFFINFTNPFVWIFWMGVVVGFYANYSGEHYVLFTFFASALLTIFSMDTLKCFSASKIKKYVQTHNLVWINRIAGIGLVLFGLYLLIRTVIEHHII